MNRYLKNIHAGKAINFEAFLKKLPDDIARRHRDYFAVEKVGPQKWRVSCLEDGLLERLEVAAVKPENRSQAAGQGDSHRHATDHAFLLVYHSFLDGPRPEVIMLSPKGAVCNFKPKKFALLVENEQNFFDNVRMLGFLGECTGDTFSLDNCDVILGSGNRVTRPLVLDWLGQYDSLFCAFDYDLGGLKMFGSIHRYLGGKAQFAQPIHWHSWYGSFRKTPGTTERFVQAIAAAECFGFEGLAEAFRKTGHFMEQETILDEH
ncbi:hypothetical protein [Marinobacter sp.]|uniref:hypothetical protein n=1 Tax=Marinobacter sp. TaxID=50741 RepID=UPI003A8D4922